jgi:hypothetical protein
MIKRAKPTFEVTRLRRQARTSPAPRPERYGELGILSQDDDGQWSATTLAGRELGTWRNRSEANEALLLAAVFGETAMRRGVGG